LSTRTPTPSTLVAYSDGLGHRRQRRVRNELEGEPGAGSADDGGALADEVDHLLVLRMTGVGSEGADPARPVGAENSIAVHAAR
jgi:hypothetical protein